MPDDRPALTAEAFAPVTPAAHRSLVDQVMDAIVEALARGLFLPGDRVVEAEIARRLNVSRIPVREALRRLESQSVVTSEKFRGMRVMRVDAERLEQILRVRLALEKLAGAEVIARLAAGTARLDAMQETLAAMHAAARAGDRFAVARLDTEFHRRLCLLSGNDVLLNSWEPLSRQMTIIFGIAAQHKPLRGVAAEHDAVVTALAARDLARFERTIEAHILAQNRALDFEAMVGQLRRTDARAVAP